MLHNKYSASYDLTINFSWQVQYFRLAEEKSQNTLVRDCQHYIQFSIFEGNFVKILGKFRINISILMLLILKNKNISQNNLVFKFTYK